MPIIQRTKIKKGKYKVLSKETIKLKLSEQFGNTQNKVIMDYFNQLKKKTVDDFEEKDGILYEKYKPLVIEGYNMAMTITSCFDAVGHKDKFNTITFTDIENEDEYARFEKIAIGDSGIIDDGYALKMENNQIKLYEYLNNIEITEDFDVILNKKETVNSLAFDVFVGRLKTSGRLLDRGMDYRLNKAVIDNFNKESWLQMIQSQNNSDFEKAIRSFGLHNPVWFKYKPMAFVRLLCLLDTCPNIRHAFSNPKWLDLLSSHVNEGSIWEPEMVLENLNPKGESLSELLMIPEEFIDYVTNNPCDYDQVCKWVLDIREAVRISHAKSDKDVLLLKKLLIVDESKRIEQEVICHLAYLINTGFTLDEIGKFADKVWQTQALNSRDCIKSWSLVVHGRALLIGRREKYYPRNVATELALYNRAINCMPETSLLLFSDKISISRIHLNEMNKSFKIEVNKYSFNNDSERATRNRNVLYCGEHVFFANQKTKKEVFMTMYGDGVYINRNEFTASEYKYFESWAKKYNFYIRRNN